MAFHPSPEASAWEWKEWVPEAPKRWAASPCKNHNTGAAKWFMLALSPCCFPAHSRRVFPLLSRTLEERLPPEFLALRLGDDDETDQEGCVGPGGAHRVVLHCGVGGKDEVDVLRRDFVEGDEGPRVRHEEPPAGRLVEGQGAQPDLGVGVMLPFTLPAPVAAVKPLSTV